jgi:ADP-ribosyl-[dinitrogen reductase] hydrolase
MLVEIAIGDAYGAGFEFCAREKIERSNTLEAYVEHELGIPAGRYTDDTQMSIAIAEVLLSGASVTSATFADAFVRCYKRDRRMGYAKGMQALFDECPDGSSLRSRIKPESRRNGEAMRSVPLGLIPNKSELLRVAEGQAVITHNTAEGVLSSRVVAFISHVLLYEQAKLSSLPGLVQTELGFELLDNWHQEVECDAIQTLHAVNTALLRNRRTSDLLIDCVNFGGDVDSVAAIAMGLASLSPEYTSDVPKVLREGLEAGPYGTPFLQGLDAALATKFPVLASRLHGR